MSTLTLTQAQVAFLRADDELAEAAHTSLYTDADDDPLVQELMAKKEELRKLL